MHAVFPVTPAFCAMKVSSPVVTAEALFVTSQLTARLSKMLPHAVTCWSSAWQLMLDTCAEKICDQASTLPGIKAVTVCFCCMLRAEGLTQH